MLAVAEEDPMIIRSRAAGEAAVRELLSARDQRQQQQQQ
jgi:hypothetical protein